MNIIIPKEKRVTIYSILDNVIINNNQKGSYLNDFRVSYKIIAKKRNECIIKMKDTDNLHSFVFVHKNENIETEINVSHPKYNFHQGYNNTK